MSLQFGKEKLRMAMLDLVAPGDIHSRVAAALGQHILHINEDEDIHPSAKSEFIQLKQSLHFEGTANHRATEAIEKMSEIEVERIAQKVVALYEIAIDGGN